MMRQVVGRKIGNSGRITRPPPFLDRIFAAQSISKDGAGLALGLFERKQGPVLAEGCPL